jgi:hypothetical protein
MIEILFGFLLFLIVLLLFLLAWLVKEIINKFE